MTILAPIRRMTIAEFQAWADARDASLSHDEPKWELFDGIPEMQESERWIHGRIKLAVTLALQAAITDAGLPFEVAIDSVGVAIGPREMYVPEVVVFPTGRIADDDRLAPDPIIVVEVLSPSSRAKDLRTKARGYSRVNTIQHYLVVDADTRLVLHYRRQGAALVTSSEPLADGILRLDPPSLEIDVAGLFA